MQFSYYLKTCREHSDLTQEQLVEALYLYDIDHFQTLESSTLSKWERGTIQPQIAKQVSIVKFFQRCAHKALPCFDAYSVEEVEALICKVGMHNLLGKSKELVLNFPSAMIGMDDLNIYQLQNSKMIDEVIEINTKLDRGFSHDFTQLQSDQFKEWALHPSNSFYVCKYNEQFFGLLFTLRLKTEVFEKVMNLEIDERELMVDDFASFDEMGSNYMLSFFAMNEKAASILFVRYYAHLIANQKSIAEVGVATMMEDARKLIGDMNLHHHGSKIIGDGLEIQSYRETLANFLACEKVVKMIFSKQECPEG